MRTLLGILGDPAKLELYDDQFFSLLNFDEKQLSFHLIGASEDDVKRKEYSEMYHNIYSKTKHLQFSPLSRLNNSTRTDARGRIGLFPSSASHLIRGPSFIFAPFPINSRSRYLKFKSKFLNRLLSPILSHHVLNLAYFPLGGKAASKTRAKSTWDTEELTSTFYDLRNDEWFDFFYLEAGSGQKSLPSDLIEAILQSQAASILDWSIDQLKTSLSATAADLRLLVPGAIYGGGIKSVAQIDDILLPKENTLLVPEIIVIGNISEENISTTYEIIERMHELEELKCHEISYIGQ